jgi:hypothetical protein
MPSLRAAFVIKAEMLAVQNGGHMLMPIDDFPIGSRPIAVETTSTGRKLEQKLIYAAVGIAPQEARVEAPGVWVVAPRPSPRRKIAVGKSVDDPFCDLLPDFVRAERFVVSLIG